MKVYKEQIDLRSHGGTPTFINITPEVKQAIANSGIRSGIVTIISPHTTCSVFFEEFVHDLTEDGTEFLQMDLNDALCKIIPDQTEIPPAGPYMYPGPEHYADVASWPDAEAYLPGGDKTVQAGQKSAADPGRLVCKERPVCSPAHISDSRKDRGKAEYTD